MQANKFLAKCFGKSTKEIRDSIQRHPHWLHIPLITIKSSLNYLQSLNYKNDEIFNSIHLVLYPVGRIESALKEIYSTAIYKNASQSQILSLCLYFIELKYNFTGDGVWIDERADVDTLTHGLEMRKRQ